MKPRIIVLISFLILTLVCIAPPIIYGYIYPDGSEDTANNISVITRMCQGTLPDFEFRYVGYAILGYPLYWLAQVLHISFPILFTWFCCLLPLFIGGVLYFIFSRLIGWLAGLSAILIVVCVSGATMYYIYQGILFNLINVTILYPSLFYFLVKWFTEKKNYQLTVSILLAGLVAVFHVSGLYLPVVMGLALVVYIIYMLVLKKKIDRGLVILSGALIVVGIGCMFIMPYTRLQIMDAIKGVSGGFVLVTPKSIQMDAIYKTVVPLPYYIQTFVGVIMVLLFIIVGWQFKSVKSLINQRVKLFLFFVACWAVIVGVMAYAKLSTLPFRQQTDLAIIIAILAATLVGLLVTSNKRMLAVVGILVAIGLYPQFFPAWFKNNSAIKVADKQAIEYVNTLDVTSYDCSSTVSQFIYDDYLKAKYQSGGDVVIVRNLPMAQGNDVNNPYYDGHGIQSTEGYNLNKEFDDGKIKVQVWQKK